MPLELNDDTLQLHLIGFLKESNMIESIIPTEPSAEAFQTALNVLSVDELTLHDLYNYQRVVAPNKPLRSLVGMDVMVGGRPWPSGGPKIPEYLARIVKKANEGISPWHVHVTFEELHPFMDGNGRTGRILWLWQMLHYDRYNIAPNEEGWSFLRTFYYQTLREHTAANTTRLAKPEPPRRSPIHEDWTR